MKDEKIFCLWRELASIAENCVLINDFCVFRRISLRFEFRGDVEM
jgi:hypothetical protein